MNAYTIKRVTVEEFIVASETEDEAFKQIDKKKVKPTYSDVTQKVLFTIDMTPLRK